LFAGSASKSPQSQSQSQSQGQQQQSQSQSHSLSLNPSDSRSMSLSSNSMHHDVHLVIFKGAGMDDCTCFAWYRISVCVGSDFASPADVAETKVVSEPLAKVRSFTVLGDVLDLLCDLLGLETCVQMVNAEKGSLTACSP
jgi:hypothetical protein